MNESSLVNPLGMEEAEAVNQPAADAWAAPRATDANDSDQTSASAHLRSRMVPPPPPLSKRRGVSGLAESKRKIDCCACFAVAATERELQRWAWTLPRELLRGLALLGSDSGRTPSYVRCLTRAAESHLLPAAAALPPSSPGCSQCERRRLDAALLWFVEYVDEERAALLEAERDERSALKEQVEKFDAAVVRALDMVGGAAAELGEA
jgi:hypothetical protein